MENTKVITRGLEREKIKRRDKIRQVYQILMLVIATSLILIITVGKIAVNQQSRLITQSEKILQLTSSNKKLIDELNTTHTTIAKYESISKTNTETINTLQGGLRASTETIDELSMELEQLKEDNLELVSDNKKLLKEVKSIGNKLTLYEKYDYAVFDKANNRTGLTYEQLKLGDELMTEKGYDPDLLFGIIMVESNGNPLAQNKVSSAKGYGQLLASTGKYVYESLLGHGKGTYNHLSLSLNGDLNIEMTANLIDYLYKLHNGNLYKAIKNYCGQNDAGTRAYINKINKHISEAGKNVYTMNVSIKK